MSPIVAFLALNPDSRGRLQLNGSPDTKQGHSSSSLLSSTFFHVLFKLLCMLSIHHSFIAFTYHIRTAWRRKTAPGPSCPVHTWPSCPIHTSADFFTFTHNPLRSLPFSMKVIENVYSCKGISTCHWLNITRWTC